MRKIFDLHLFDAAAAGGESAAASQMQESGQPAQENPGAAPEGQPTQAAQNEDREAKFDEILKEYKDLYDKRVGDTVKKRLKGASQVRQQYEALTSAVLPLYQMHGVEPGDIEGLTRAIQTDDGYWERGAEEAGMTVEQYKQMQMTAAENQRLNRMLQQQEAEQAANRQMQAWQQEAEGVKAVYSDFDLMTEVQNPLFAELISSKNPATRLSLKAAYEACHVEEIRQMAARNAYQTAENNVARTIQANGNRPRENAAGAQAAAKPPVIDIKSLTKAQRRELEARAERGERITFREGS